MRFIHPRGGGHAESRSGRRGGRRGGVLVAALGSAALAAAAPGLGCRHEPAPAAVQPGETPPLPPASGTPIGFLVDDAGELALSDDQLARLKAIDDDLASRLAALDGVVRNIQTAPPPAKDDGKGRGLGFRAGGGRLDRGSQVSGGMETFPGSSGGSGGAGGAAGAAGGTVAAGDGAARARAAADNATVLDHAADQRTHELRSAIARALAVLDRRQQQIARRVLAEHGIDPDTGGAGSAAAASQPASTGSGSN